MIRITLILFAALVAATVAVMGLRGQTGTRPPLWIFPDMQEQPKYKPQAQSQFFADGRVQRPPVAGSVPWGRAANARDESVLATSQQLFALDRSPMQVDRALLSRGQLLYGTYCAVCHGGTGSGNGMTTQYGMNNPPSYHIDRLRYASDGYLFQVITEGKNTMGPYGDRVHRDDRWAIVAYVRALQLSQMGTIDDVPEALRGELNR
jgi:mono/diheme cytochrome c family protein